MRWRIKPLTSSLDDSTRLHHHACSSSSSSSSLALLLLLPKKTLFFSQALKFLFGFCVHNGKKRKGKWFYNLLAPKYMFDLWHFEWKENEEKWFIKVFLLVSQG